MFQPGVSLTVNNARTALEAGLKAIEAGQGTIDFQHLTAADSAAVATLLAWRRAARERGVALAFTNLPQNLRSLAAMYGVTDLLDADFGARADLPHH